MRKKTAKELDELEQHRIWDKEDTKEIAKIERAQERYEKARDKADAKAERKALKSYEKELDKGLRL